MEFKAKSGTLLGEKSDAAIICVFEGEKPAGALLDADKALGGLISSAIKDGEYSGKPGEVMFFHSASALKGGPAKIIIAGLGKKETFTGTALMGAAGSAAGMARKLGLKSITASAEGIGGLSPCDTASLIVQGIEMGMYTIDTFKTPDPKKKVIDRVTLIASADETSGVKAGVAEGSLLAGSVNFARDMINAPANRMTPSDMAKQAKAAGKEFGFKVKVLEESDCRKLGMGAFLGVSAGSEQPAKFIVMEYNGSKKKNAKPTVVVGKAITFDSGGISIKPSDGMDKMKYDMAGGAATIGIMRAAAALKLPVNLVGLVPASENLPSGGALKPGDVVKSMNGKTSEIISTDAEGRLVLSDALCYASRYKPEAVIDIATLTGACVIALGDLAIGLMTNNAELAAKVKTAADATGERVWELPMWDEYLERMKGDVTDLKNVGGRQAATVTAGKYLEEFVDYPWVHLDIAGTAWEERGKPYQPKGARGTGVRLIIEYLKTVK